MDTFNKPYISVGEKPKNDIADLNGAISWNDSDIGFNWLNTDFPYMHRHSHWELFIITQGSLTHVINGKKYVMTKGTACLLRPQDQHMLCKYDEKPVTHLSFLFKSSYSKQLFDTVQNGLYEQALHSFEELTFPVSEYDLNQICTKMRGVQRFIPELAQENIAKTKICFLNVFEIFLSHWLNFKSSFPPWLEALLGELNNSKLFLASSEEIAKLTPYSYSRMCAIFKQHVGIPLAKYLNKLRMNHATTLLVNSTSSILDIALDLGYDSISSFNHSFKAMFGVSPSVYRKINLKK